MKMFLTSSRVPWTPLFLCFSLLALRSQAADSAPPKHEPTKEEFAPVAKAVAGLLQSRDVAHFVGELAPSIEDYQAILATNKTITGDDPIKSVVKSLEYQRKSLETSAKAVLERADALHLDFSKGTLDSSVILPKSMGRIHRDNFKEAPYVEKLEMIVSPSSTNGLATNGEFRLAVRGLTKFASAWRSDSSVQWLAFPASVADDKTTRELSLLAKAANREGFTDKEDPALHKLSEKMVQFIRQQDTNLFQKEIYFTADLMWAEFQKSGRTGPSREEFDKEMASRSADQYALANSMVKLMADGGVDLKDADLQITEAAVKRCQAQGSSIDGLMGSQFTLKIAVKSDKKSKSNASLAGQYILAANQIMWLGDQWRVADNIHWYALPAGLID